jgi:hypothetical protein
MFGWATPAEIYVSGTVEGEDMGDARVLVMIGPWYGGEQRRRSNLINKSSDPDLRMVDWCLSNAYLRAGECQTSVVVV